MDFRLQYYLVKLVGDGYVDGTQFETKITLLV
jgi:hypothetical protein